MGLKCVCVLGRWIWCGSRRDCFKEGAGMTVRLQAPRGRTGSVDWKRLLNEERKEPRLGKGPGVVERKATWLGMEKTRNLSLFNGGSRWGRGCLSSVASIGSPGPSHPCASPCPQVVMLPASQAGTCQWVGWQYLEQAQLVGSPSWQDRIARTGVIPLWELRDAPHLTWITPTLL